MIYPIRILNELHELYPDLLYNPSQFESGADVINYIVERSIHGPYQQEFTRYQQDREQRERREALEERIQRIREEQEAEDAQRDVEREVRREVQAQTNALARQISSMSSPIVEISIPPVPPSSQNTVMSQLISFLIDDGLFNTNSRSSSFTLRPTSEELARSTTVIALLENYDNVCSICHDGLLVGQNVRRINHCRHMFHQSCIDTWFSSRSTCPTCRHDIRTSL